jgi:GR25 family glycosyltransferase involved in LPS biosynthesis
MTFFLSDRTKNKHKNEMTFQEREGKGMIPIFVINLDRSMDRWDVLEKEFLELKSRQEQKNSKVGDLIRISAVDGKKELYNIDPKRENIESIISLQTLFDLKNNTAPPDHRFLSCIGAIACTLSHNKIYDLMIEKNISMACVFEDDTCFMKGKSLDDFDRVLEEIMNTNDNNNKNTDLYLLRYEAMHKRINEKEKDEKKMFFDVNGLFHNTGSYVITLKGAKKLKRLLFPISLHMDNFLGTCANLGKLNIKGLKKQFIFLKDRNLSSTIQHSSRKKINHASDFTWDEEDLKMYKIQHSSSKKINHPADYTWDEENQKMHIKSSPNIQLILLVLCILFFLLFIIMLILAFKWRKS